MKKILSFVLALSIVVSAFAVNFNLILTADSAKNGIGWIYTFDSASKIDNQVRTTTANVVYDEQLNAMKINAKADNEVNSTKWLMCSSISNISVEEYKYMAMRVKLSSDDLADCTARQRPTTSNNPTWGRKNYDATTEWQTVYFDVSLLYYENKNSKVYSEIEVTMADWMGASVKSSDTFYVAWIGGFGSLEDIELYSLSEANRFSGARVFEFDDLQKAQISTTTKTYAKTKTVEGVQISVLKAVDNISYDSENNALLLEPTVYSGDHYVYIDCSQWGISAKDYPIVAYKAKWSQEAVNSFSAVGATIVTSNIKAITESSEAITPNPNYGFGPENGGTGLSAKTSDWQIAYQDFSSAQFTDNYNTVVLDVIGAYTWNKWVSIMGNLPIYIEWVGLFSSIEEACAYDAECAIDKLSYAVTADSADGIGKANEAYNALDDGVKTCVSNYAYLQSTNRIFDLVKRIDDAATRYTDRMNGEEFAVLGAIENDYNALTQAERCRVGGYSKISETLELSRIAYTIAQLPQTVTWEQKSDLEYIQTAYSALSLKQKARISNYMKFISAKEKYDEIKLADRYDLNIDESIDIRDLVLLKKSQFVSGAVVRTTRDINLDGNINASDLAAYRRMLLTVKTDATAENLLGNIKVDTDNMQKIETETFTVYGYNADRKFNHGAYINYFNGKFYAFWQQGYIAEDCCGQRIVYSTSVDGANWTSAQDLIAMKKDSNGNEMLINPFGTYVNGNELIVYVYEYAYNAETLESSTQGEGILRPDNSESSSVKTNISFYCFSTKDGVNWTRGNDLPLNSGGNRDPHLLPSGRLIWAGWNTSAYTDDLSGTQWNATSLSLDAIKDAMQRGGFSTLTEAVVYSSSDNVLHMLMRTNTGKLWGSSSRDNGETWSGIFATSFTDDSQKFDFINLPDGRVMYIGTPVYSGKNKRLPLVVSISEDGYVFNKSFIIGDTEYTSQSNDKTKLGNYSYPSAMIHGDDVYVIYAKQKEIIEVTRFKLSDLK